MPKIRIVFSKSNPSYTLGELKIFIQFAKTFDVEEVFIYVNPANLLPSQPTKMEDGIGL